MTRLVTQEKEQGAQHSGSSAIKETWALQGTKQIEAVRQDYGLLYVNFCPMHAVVHPPDYKCPQFMKFIKAKMASRAQAKEAIQQRAEKRATAYANARASTSTAP